jgi:hypothetical protein
MLQVREAEPVGTAGAPLRIFFLICTIWILGRITWETNLPAQPGLNIMAGRDEYEHFNLADSPARTPSALQPDSAFHKRESGHPRFSVLEVVRPEIRLSEYFHQESKPISTASPSRIAGARGGTASQSVPAFSGPAADNEKRAKPCCKKWNIDAFRSKKTASWAAKQGPVKKQNSALSGYFWLFARDGTSARSPVLLSTALRPGMAQYGGSQAGAILSLRLAGDQSRNISVYSRFSSSLAADRSNEMAIGSKLRPIKGLPISLYAEKRFLEGLKGQGGVAVFAAGGTGPDKIAQNLFVETYGQAGYVFREDGSYFFDGSAAIKKRLATTGSGQISLGGAVWAGGQEGAQRLDIGPSLNIDVPMANVATRISVDWRQRVAGNAEPNSGIAVSLSASF